MSTISFNKNKPAPEPKAIDIDIDEAGVLATQDNDRAPAAYHNDGVMSEYGELSARDVITPYLLLVSKNGSSADTYKPGNFLYNQQVELTAPLKVSVLHLKKYYKEAQPYGGEEQGRVFDTMEEVRAAGLRLCTGGTPIFGEEVKEEANMLLFVFKPDGYEDTKEQFLHTLPSGQVGGLAMYTSRGTSYNSTAKMAFTAILQNQYVKTNGIWSLAWDMKSEFKKGDKFSWWFSLLSPSGKLDPKDAEYLKDFIPSRS